MFQNSVTLYRDRVAFINMGAEMTYGELDVLSRDFCGVSANEPQTAKGRPQAAIMMPNVLQYPVCMLGALRAGCVVVN